MPLHCNRTHFKGEVICRGEMMYFLSKKRLFIKRRILLLVSGDFLTLSGELETYREILFPIAVSPLMM